MLVQSGADPYCDSEEYMLRGCGMGRESTNYLTERGVKLVGTDAWSWDRPLPLVAEEFAKLAIRASFGRGILLASTGVTVTSKN